MSDLAIQKSGGISIQTLGELQMFAKVVCDAGWAPKGMSPPQAMVAMQMGMELGLTPMQGLQNIAVINGHPSVYGDALPALVKASGLLEDYEEKMTRDGAEGLMAVVKVKRRGCRPIVRTFSERRAKQAKLWHKQGPWTDYPERMLLMRARTFAFRDEFADVLKGLTTVEEARDIPVENGVAEVVQPKQLPSLDEAFKESKAFFRQSRKQAVDIEPEPEVPPHTQEMLKEMQEWDGQPDPEMEFVATEPIPEDPPPEPAPVKRGPGRPRKQPPPPPPPRDQLPLEEQLRSDIRDCVLALRNHRVPAKEPPDLETASVDDLRKSKARLQQALAEIENK